MNLDEACILYIDGGTTRTRTWAAVGDRVVASAQAEVGARDVAREGGRGALADALRRLIVEDETRCRAASAPAPSMAVAAGMITSRQGLLDVPHVEAPAGVGELARAAACEVLPDVSSLRIVFVPGVRTSGPQPATRETIRAADVMRGEETLAVGLVRRGQLAGGGALLSLGSHWKVVRVDAAGRIGWSASTLSGELIEAVRSHTILASSLPSGWPPALSPEWVHAGFEAGRYDRLTRALYEVRLLDQGVASEPADRLAFLVGAVVAASVDTLLPASAGLPPRVVLAGPRALARVWETTVHYLGGTSMVLDEDEAGAAFRAGCRAVLEAGPLT